jgi:hypothetical protein
MISSASLAGGTAIDVPILVNDDIFEPGEAPRPAAPKQLYRHADQIVKVMRSTAERGFTFDNSLRSSSTSNIILMRDIVSSLPCLFFDSFSGLPGYRSAHPRRTF